MNPQRIFVAGGAGLVGANLTHRLLELGYPVAASYHRKPPSLHLPVYRQYDFTHFSDCLKATENQEIVILAAALSVGIKMLKTTPTAQFLPNLQIQAGLLEACSRNRVGKVVMISSATVYSDSHRPLKEKDLDLNRPPPFPYEGLGGFHRYMEQLGWYYAHTYSMNIDIVRASTIYGPHDVFDEDRSRVVPALIKRAVEKQVPFIVWGDGSQIRDFIYVDDFINDLLLVMKEGCRGEPVNIGTGSATTIRKLIETVLKACDHAVSPVFDASKPVSVHYRAVDISKLTGLFGPRPRTELDTGIRKTLEWYLKSRAPTGTASS